MYHLSKSAVLPSALLALTLACDFSAQARNQASLPRQRVTGHLRPEVATLQPTGTLPGTNRLSLAIALPLRNQGALSQLLADLYDPASPRYHQYLTPKQFTAQFGPTEADYEALAAF